MFLGSSTGWGNIACFRGVLWQVLLGMYLDGSTLLGFSTYLPGHIHYLSKTAVKYISGTSRVVFSCSLKRGNFCGSCKKLRDGAEDATRKLQTLHIFFHLTLSCYRGCLLVNVVNSHESYGLASIVGNVPRRQHTSWIFNLFTRTYTLFVQDSSKIYLWYLASSIFVFFEKGELLWELQEATRRSRGRDTEIADTAYFFSFNFVLLQGLSVSKCRKQSRELWTKLPFL